MKAIIQFYLHGLVTAIFLSVLSVSVQAQQIVVEGKPGETGIFINNSGWNGIWIFQPGGQGVYVDHPDDIGIHVDGVGTYGGFFTSASSSTDPALFASHDNDLLDDLFLGGDKGRIGTDDDILIHLDRDNNTTNHFAVTDGGGTVRLQVNEDGDGFVTGNWNKASGSFKIDHPLDPANKYLYHSFVESPDMMNVYNGNVVLNAKGEATIEMPDWFEALNSDFRYQLTPIGAPGPNLYVAREITVNTFHIAGGAPGMKVSWQVTGIRQDPYANENRIKVEVMKEVQNQGKYLHPDVWEKATGITGLKSITANDHSGEYPAVAVGGMHKRRK